MTERDIMERSNLKRKRQSILNAKETNRKQRQFLKTGKPCFYIKPCGISIGYRNSEIN